MCVPKFIDAVYAKSTCLYTHEQVEVALDKLASNIDEKLYDKNPLVLTVLVGGLVAAGHLLTRLNFPLTLDYIHATRYNGGLTGADLEWRITPTSSLKNRVILIIDDILDEGITLAAIINYCQEQGAKAVYTAVLIEKITRRAINGLKNADFVALTAPKQYLFGYGLDYQGYLRNASGIFAVAKEHH